MDKIIRSSWINGQASEMSTATAIAQSLERKERQHVPNKSMARRRLAGKLRIGIGTLENIVRGRVKKIDAEIKRRLDDLLIRELEAEINRLNHELEMAVQVGAHPCSEHISEIEAHLAEARRLLNR